MDFRDHQSESGSSLGLRNRSAMTSFALHALLLTAMYLVGMYTPPPEELPEETKMDMVLVKMPSPEPPGSQAGGGPADDKELIARPKALARRSFNTPTVTQRANVATPAVQQISPTQVMGAVNKIDVQQPVRTNAPKILNQRIVENATVDPLQVADVKQADAASAASVATPTVRESPTMAQSSGPRKMEAAAPVLSQSSSNDYSQIPVADGVIGDVSVPGDADGPKIRTLANGSGQLYGASTGRGNGTGNGAGNGTGSGVGMGNGSGNGPGDGSGGGPKDCSRDPACSGYLELIRQRVYARWSPGKDVPVGKVRLKFRIDQSGSAHGVELVNTENRPLGDSCLVAFQHASPFPPPPPQIAYIINKNLVATFDFADKGR